MRADVSRHTKQKHVSVSVNANEERVSIAKSFLSCTQQLNVSCRRNCSAVVDNERK